MKHFTLGAVVNILLFLVLALSPLPLTTHVPVGTVSSITPASAADDITPVEIPSNTGGSPITGVASIIALFKIALRYTAIIFWMVSIGLVFYSAYLFAASGGDPKAVASARGYLMYAAIGMAIGIMAYGLPVLVKDILSGGGSNNPSSLPTP